MPSFKESIRTKRNIQRQIIKNINRIHFFDKFYSNVTPTLLLLLLLLSLLLYTDQPRGLVVRVSEVPGSIPGSTVGIFLEGEDSRGDHGLGRLVEFRFKAPPGTTSSYITTHTPSGQRNCASRASQPQKSVTLLPCPGGRTTKSTKDMWWHWGGGYYANV